MRRTMGIAAILLLGTIGVGARAEAPSLTAISPLRDDGWLACRILTEGLPGERLASSMRGGIVSAVDLDVDVLDGRERTVARARVTFRLAFDLWEEVFSVSIDDRVHRLADLDTLRSWLSRPPALPLLPSRDLAAAEGPLVLRGRLTLHAIAPGDRRRVQEIIAGDGGNDRDEATISLGRLIRFFHRDRNDVADPSGAVRSRPFRLEELTHAVDP